MTPQEQKHVRRVSRVMRAARKIAGKNQVEVAREIELSQSALSKMEAGLLMPSASQWFHLCEVLGLDPSETFMQGYIDRGLSASWSAAFPESSFKLPKKYFRNAGSKARTLQPFIRYLESAFGEKYFADYCEHAKVDPDFFVVYDNQLSMDFSLDLAKTMISGGRLKEAQLPRLVHSVTQPGAHGILHQSYDHADTGIEVLRMLLANNVQKYEINFNYLVEDMKGGGLVVSAAPSDRVSETGYRDAELGDFVCRYRKEYFRQFASYRCSHEDLTIQEQECHFKGAPKCVYRLKIAS